MAKSKQRRVLGTPSTSPQTISGVQDRALIGSPPPPSPNGQFFTQEEESPGLSNQYPQATSPFKSSIQAKIQSPLAHKSSQLQSDPDEGHSEEPKNTGKSVDTGFEPAELNDSHIVCPICNEQMINAYQLNQHIDDVHMNDDDESNITNPDSTSGSPTPRNDRQSPSFLGTGPQNSIHKIINNEFIKTDIKKWFNGKDLTPLKRKTLNLDLFEGNKAFSLSDGTIASEPSSPSKQSKSPTTPLNKPRISRAHWVQPSSSSICHMNNCSKPLNVKNGVVNCRKCGFLFCNHHTTYKVRLRNPQSEKDEKVPQYDPEGIWSKCCENCYFNKPDLVLGTQVNSRDMTNDFKLMRLKLLDNHHLVRDKLIKKFIKIVNLIGEFYLHHEQYQKRSILSYYSSKADYELLSERQKEIIGYENWENDHNVHNCSICLVQFGFLIRKHHCRLCGKIVCDDRFGERQNCSLLVPISKFMERLNYLNFSLQVRENFDRLLEAKDDMFLLRVCKDCKNDLLYDYRMKMMHETDSQNLSQPSAIVLNEIFNQYNQLLIVKFNIKHHLPKYESTLLSPDINIENTNKAKERIMAYLKEFETLILNFKNRYYDKTDIKPQYVRYQKLLNGINQSLIFFLQENLIHFKNLNNTFKEKEQQLIPRKSNQIEKPRLTKKEIRELREQLMVMNEQKFIIENLINDVTKQRKFDEIQPLMNNKQEITNEIDRLENELGEFGF